MKIFCIGDAVSKVGRAMLFKHVEEIKFKKNIDFVIVNGENAAHGNGLTRSTYDELMRAGCDAVTLGNHAWGAREVADIMRLEDNVIRPANFSGECPGDGYMIKRAANGVDVAVINVIGQTFMQPANSAFEAAMALARKLRKTTRVIMVDFHAEATSEKEALGFYLDGHVSAVFGTHTHVQTADECVLPNGTGYITDLGMTGVQVSVLGMDKDPIIKRFLNGMPQKFRVAEGKGQLCGCIFDIDEDTGLCRGAERVYIRER